MFSIISPSMVKTFNEVNEGCAQSFPCKHNNFQITLINGQTVTKYLHSVDIYSILKALKDLNRLNETTSHSDWMWEHFSIYKDIESMDMGWKIRPAEEILTKLFNEESKNKPKSIEELGDQKINDFEFYYL